MEDLLKEVVNKVFLSKPTSESSSSVVVFAMFIIFVLMIL